MQERSSLLVLGLPNSTSCTREQDQLYEEFKGKTRSGFREEYDHEDNTVVTPAMKVVLERLKKAIHTVSLTNDDLSLIINNKPNDRLCSPFSTFTKEKSLTTFLVLFMFLLLERVSRVSTSAVRLVKIQKIPPFNI